MKNKKILCIYIGVFLLFSGSFYMIFDKLIPAGAKNNETVNVSNEEEELDIKTGFLSFEGPKTEVCPINGQLYTAEEMAIWEKRRPLLIMIENHEDARPQSGLNNADMVYEAIAEGGITRFMGVYYCDASRIREIRYDVGPVRSARTYYLDIASEYGDYPLYTHVGGANCSAPKDPTTGQQAGPCTTDKRALAIEQISQYGWNNKGTWSDLSQFSLSYRVCRREPDRTGQSRATEHTMYCSTKELWKVAADERGLTNVTEASGDSWDDSFLSWLFDKDGSSQAGLATENVSLAFWNSDAYKVTWKYDASSGKYVRYHENEKQIDFNDKEAIEASNIVIQLVKETQSVDEHKHNLYGVVGTGKGILIQAGKRIDVTWSKKQRQGRTTFKDSNGKEVKFIPGKIWVEILPENSKIDYEIGSEAEANNGV